MRIAHGSPVLSVENDSRILEIAPWAFSIFSIEDEIAPFSPISHFCTFELPVLALLHPSIDTIY